jgi:hypothetical protein
MDAHHGVLPRVLRLLSIQQHQRINASTQYSTQSAVDRTLVIADPSESHELIEICMGEQMACQDKSTMASSDEKDLSLFVWGDNKDGRLGLGDER